MSRIAKLADYLEHEFTTPEDREQIAAILRDVDELTKSAREMANAIDPALTWDGELVMIAFHKLRNAIAKIEAHK